MRSIPTETAYRFRMLAERAGRFRTQAEVLRTQADKSILEARNILQAAGLDPETDDPITDEDVTRDGVPLPVGTILRRGQPIEDEHPVSPEIDVVAQRRRKSDRHPQKFVDLSAPAEPDAVAKADAADAQIDPFIEDQQHPDHG